MNTSQEKNFGYDLEDKLYDKLKELSIFSDIIQERDLVKQWGYLASGIDHYLVIDNYFIAIQTKWQMTRRRENKGIENFLKSLEYIQTKTNKTLLFGLWASRLEPFSDNIEKLKSNKVYVSYCISTIDELIEKSIKLILYNMKT